MADEREFRIKITGDASGLASASRQGADALNETTSATKKAAGATEEHAHSFIHAESQGRAFHKVLHEITSASPLLGAALRLALNPVVGLLTLLAMAVEAFREKWSQAAEEAKQRSEGLVEAFNRALDSAQELKEKGVQAEEAFANEFANIVEEHDKALARIQRVTAALENEKQALLELSKLRGEDKHKQDEIGIAADERALKAKEVAVAEAEARKAGLVHETTAAQEAAEGPGAAGRMAAIAEAERRLNELKERAKSTRSLVPGFGWLFGSVSPDMAAIEFQMRPWRESIQANTDEQRQAEDRLARARGAELENQRFIERTGAEIETARPGLTSRAAGVSLEGNQPLSGVVARGAEALHELREHGGKLADLSPQMVQQIRALNTYLNAIGANNHTMLNLIEGAHGNVQAIAERVRAIEQRQEQIARRFGI
jgi:hypothetical protein